MCSGSRIGLFGGRNYPMCKGTGGRKEGGLFEGGSPPPRDTAADSILLLHLRARTVFFTMLKTQFDPDF